MAEKKIKNETEVNYLLIGVASSLKEYKFCFHLNQLLNVDFIKLSNHTPPSNDRTRIAEFSVFKAGEDEEDRLQFFVFANKNLGELLLPEASNFDYILQIKGDCSETEMAAIVSGVKDFPEVIACAEIPLKKIKNKDRLIYFEEREIQKPIIRKRFFQ